MQQWYSYSEAASVTFADWEEHYSSYGASDIIADAATFPPSTQLNRMLAFLKRLIEVISNDHDMSYEQRLDAAKLAISCGQLLCTHERVAPALRATLDIQKIYGLYPAIAAVVEEGTFAVRN